MAITPIARIATKTSNFKNVLMTELARLPGKDEKAEPARKAIVKARLTMVIARLVSPK